MFKIRLFDYIWLNDNPYFDDIAQRIFHIAALLPFVDYVITFSELLYLIIFPRFITLHNNNRRIINIIIIINILNSLYLYFLPNFVLSNQTVEWTFILYFANVILYSIELY